MFQSSERVTGLRKLRIDGERAFVPSPSLSLQPRAHYHGFEILSRGSRMKRLDGEAELPELFVKGKETYRANLNAENPVGTMQSIEHALRALDRLAEEERHERTELIQLGRPGRVAARL